MSAWSRQPAIHCPLAIVSALVRPDTIHRSSGQLRRQRLPQVGGLHLRWVGSKVLGGATQRRLAVDENDHLVSHLEGQLDVLLDEDDDRAGVVGDGAYH